MSKMFTEEEIKILNDVSVELDEFHVEDRKGISMNRYVFEVPEDVYWDDWENDIIGILVPDELIGTWMMGQEHDLMYDNLDDCIASYSWVKCKQVEKVVKVWKEV